MSSWSSSILRYTMRCSQTSDGRVYCACECCVQRTHSNLFMVEKWVRFMKYIHPRQRWTNFVFFFRSFSLIYFNEVWFVSRTFRCKKRWQKCSFCMLFFCWLHFHLCLFLWKFYRAKGGVLFNFRPVKCCYCCFCCYFRDFSFHSLWIWNEKLEFLIHIFGRFVQSFVISIRISSELHSAVVFSLVYSDKFPIFRQFRSFSSRLFCVIVNEKLKTHRH